MINKNEFVIKSPFTKLSSLMILTLIYHSHFINAIISHPESSLALKFIIRILNKR